MRRSAVLDAGIQQKHGEYFFFQHISVEEIVGNCHQVVESFFAANHLRESSRQFAYFSRVPSTRLNLILEKVLHLSGVRSTPAVNKDASQMIRNVSNRLGHISYS